jgi:hypothetical protein
VLFDACIERNISSLVIAYTHESYLGAEVQTTCIY